MAPKLLPSYSPPPQEKVDLLPIGDVGGEKVNFGERHEAKVIRGRRDTPYCRLELLVFNDDDTLKWIFRCKRYFNVDELSEKE